MLPSAINLLIYSAHMLSFVFIPNLAKDFGAGNFMVGVIVGVYATMSFISYTVFGRASDMYGRRLILRAGLLVTAVSFLLQVAATDPTTLFLARALAGFCMGVGPAALIAYVYEAKSSIGKFSSYGSLGWAVGGFLAGVVASYKGIFVLSSVFLFLAFLVSLRMPSAGEHRVKVPVLPVALIKKNKNVYVPFFLRHFGASIAWTVFPLYMVGIGASFFWIGILHTINTGTQALVMRRLDPVDNDKLIMWGLVLSVFVFLAYALATDYLQLIPVQLMLGFAWAFLFVGSLESLLEGNVERATASGVLNSTINLGGILGPLAAGVIIVVSGFKAAMLASGALCLMGLVYRMLSAK